MSHSRHFAAILAVTALLTALPAGAQQSAPAANAANASIPALVNFAGGLKNTDGKPASGVVGVRFALYLDEEGGSPLWLETQNVTLDASGHYSVMLGAGTKGGLPTELFTAKEARWLGIEPQGLPAPARVLLLSVPYALKAGDAETIGGLPPSAFVRAAVPSSGSTAEAPSSGSVPPPSSPVTTAGGSSGKLPLWDGATDITNSAVVQTGSGTTARVGIGTTTPASTLDIKGGSTVRGLLKLPPTNAATAAGGKNSQVLNLGASAFNSGTSTAVTQNFQWRAEPVGNNTTNATGKLSLLFGQGSATPAETGLQIGSNGQITFATGQSFPGTGSGTITGVTVGTGLTGGGTSGNVPVNLDMSQVPLLSAANIFTASQTVTGNLAASGTVSGGVVNAGSSFTLGGTPFAFGTSTFFSTNAFVGFAGNAGVTGNNNFGAGNGALGSLTSGADNTAVGVNALPANDVGGDNTAIGRQALFFNNAGNSNTAEGSGALFGNSSGNGNTAVGVGALEGNSSGSSNSALGAGALASNSGGSNNTAVGASAGTDPGHLSLSNTTAIGANAQVTASNSMVLGSIKGVNGANADTNVGIGTTAPAAKLDVHGNANFTGPITFASGQVFPGTISGVTPGTGLSGGGTSGNVPVSLNTSFTDGRYAQLAASNTFTGAQETIGGSVGIGTVPNPAFALQAIGTIRSETGGLSIGGNAPVKVDAPGVSGGRFTILPNGNVGINKATPTTNLDVGGNVNASGSLTGAAVNVGSAGLSVGGNTVVSGSLQIGGDTPMSSNPHMIFSGMFPGSFCGDYTCGNTSCSGAYCAGPGGYFVADKNIAITRISIVVASTVDPSCSVSPIVWVYTDHDQYSLTIKGLHYLDSGPIWVTASAGAQMQINYTPAGACNLGSSGGGGAYVTVQYVML